MAVSLIEPHAGGRISGGFLYNARMAQHEPSIERRAVRPEHLASDLPALAAPRGWLLADSLFLNGQHLPLFRRYCNESGHRLGVVLHAFPSFIRRASDRALLARSQSWLPSEEEVRLLEQIDLLIAPGPYAPRLLAECGSTLRSVVCPPGVDRPLDAPARPAQGSQRVELISIGSVTRLKGFEDALTALWRIGSADFRWTIVGHLGVEPEHVAELRQRIAELGLGDRVILAGQRSHADTLATLRDSDVLVLPSYTENHPLVALEAIAAGVPVVGYAAGGLPDVIRHGQEGLLAPLLDVSALARHLAQLIENPGERRRLAEGCRRAADTLWPWDRAARHFLETLNRSNG